ncbi:glycosyltransferase family 4 protein [Thiolapillus sp.]
MKPRLLIITNLYPTPWDHQRGTFNFQQFNRLAEHLDIRLVVPVSWKERLRHGRRRATPLPPHPLEGRAVYPWYWYTPGLFRASYGLTLQASLALQCNRLTREFNPDLLLSSWAYPEGVAGTRIAGRLGIPAFVKVHGSDINVIASRASIQKQIRAWGRQVEGIASVSAALKKKMVSMGIDGKKIRVIYNGIDHQRFHPLPRKEARTRLAMGDSRIILYVGNLKREKGCVDLAEAFVRIAPHHPDLRLCIAGAGTMRETIAATAARAGLEHRVILLGKVDHEDLNHWYNAADLVCLPSYNEGVPNVLLEAMACGTPVVATGVGGIPEVVNENTGLLSEAGDLQALTRNLETALARQWNRNTIHGHALNFSWDENIRQMLDMFNIEGRHQS